MYKVLLVEDELMLAKIVKESLEVRGFTMLHAADGAAGLQLYRTQRPDILVVDIMMPRLDGLSLTAEIRKTDPQIPIIFLTARSQTTDVVKGFETGGNDYLKKPFSMDELIVRIKALLNRSQLPQSPADATYTIGQFSFDFQKQSLQHGSSTITLSHREAAILQRLCACKNQVLERRQVLLDLWGDDNFFNARSMDVFITKLRRHLKPDPALQIVNIRGVGYKLIEG
jgi:DNA-binding response OmpR family regulator